MVIPTRAYVAPYSIIATHPAIAKATGVKLTVIASKSLIYERLRKVAKQINEYVRTTQAKLF